MLIILDHNLTKAAKILGVTRGALMSSLLKLGGKVSIRKQQKSLGAIQWDGTARGADKVLRHMPDLTVATCGGAPGCPAQLFLQSKRGRQIGQAKNGDWIGVDWNGSACIVPAPTPIKGGVKRRGRN
jgi:hypothetical protein